MRDAKDARDASKAPLTAYTYELVKNPEDTRAELTFSGYEGILVAGDSNGVKSLILQSEEDGPIARITVNIPSYGALRPDEIIIKSWSENEGMVEAMVDAGYVNAPHDKAETGFTHGDVCRLTKKGLRLFYNDFVVKFVQTFNT